MNNINKKKVRKKTFRKNMCSAGRRNFTCYKPKSLKYLKDKWNKSNNTKKIKATKPKEIWKKLKKRLSKKCNDEKCWLDQDFIKNDKTSELNNYTFAPETPNKWYKNKNQWLSSSDILKVMRQYEHENKDFKFI